MEELKEIIRGLEVRDAEVREIVEDGKKRKRSFPLVRKMTEADVVSWKEYPDEYVIVSKDGRKQRVPKAAPKAKKEK